MMGVTNGDRQCVRRIRSRQSTPGNCNLHHMRNLAFVSMANTNNGFLYFVWGIFTNSQSALRWHQHRRCPVLGPVSAFPRHPCLQRFAQPQPCAGHSATITSVRPRCNDKRRTAKSAPAEWDNAVRNMANTRTINIDNPPPHIPEAPDQFLKRAPLRDLPCIVVTSLHK